MFTGIAEADQYRPQRIEKNVVFPVGKHTCARRAAVPGRRKDAVTCASRSALAVADLFHQTVIGVAKLASSALYNVTAERDGFSHLGFVECFRRGDDGGFFSGETRKTQRDHHQCPARNGSVLPYPADSVLRIVLFSHTSSRAYVARKEQTAQKRVLQFSEHVHILPA